MPSMKKCAMLESLRLCGMQNNKAYEEKNFSSYPFCLPRLKSVFKTRAFKAWAGCGPSLAEKRPSQRIPLDHKHEKVLWPMSFAHSGSNMVCLWIFPFFSHIDLFIFFCR
jgi:hypothetical protein